MLYIYLKLRTFWSTLSQFSKGTRGINQTNAFQASAPCSEVPSPYPILPAHAFDDSMPMNAVPQENKTMKSNMPMQTIPIDNTDKTSNDDQNQRITQYSISSLHLRQPRCRQPLKLTHVFCVRRSLIMCPLLTRNLRTSSILIRTERCCVGSICDRSYG